MDVSIHNMQEYEALLAKEREKFITDRAYNENIINNWLSVARQWPADMKAKLPFDVDSFNLQQYMPAWYSDNSTQEEVDQQEANLNSLIEAANRIIMEENNKAVNFDQQMSQLEGAQ